MGLLVVGVLSAGLLAGCAPEPAPSPAPTPTVTALTPEEEAFRAAEATYRAYVDALNRVDLADPATFEPVYAWLADEALAESQESLQEMHVNSLTVSGQSKIDRIEYHGLLNSNVVSEICLNVTDVDLLDENGRSVVSESRKDLQPVRVTFAPADTTTGLKIGSSAATGAGICG